MLKSDFKIDYREREAKIFRLRLQQEEVNRLPDQSWVVISMKFRDYQKLLKIESLN